MEVNYRGAEAIVETRQWLGHKVIFKTRNKRGYRHPSLEKKLVKERLRSESRIIERLISRGVNVPAIYGVDISNNCIIMEYIDGITLEKALRGKDFEQYLAQTAQLLSLLHSLNVVHGDPTTSNFMVTNSIYAIDFGLSTVSEDDEDRASDLRVFLESLDSHHSEISGREIFLSHYSEWSSSASVIEALKVLELRGRYNLMRG
jgi:TP53 regulating kinase-like protein|tara:strand:- start:8493 stop:9101 length:609 start_codon:yes stop_codon:yes gene_type:complete